MKSPVHISKMSGKLEGIPAINTNTLSNPFCVKMNAGKSGTICEQCYSHSMLNSYRRFAVDAFERNSKALSESIIHEDGLPVFNEKYVRFSAHGELINDTHFKNLLNICKHNPKTTFALWTKRKDIVKRVLDKVNSGLKYRAKPENLILVYSTPKIKDNSVGVQLPVWFDKVFTNVTDKAKHLVNCEGKCIDCLKCYKHNPFTIDIYEPVKINGRIKK